MSHLIASKRLIPLCRLEPRLQGPSGVVGQSDSSVGYGQDFQGYGTRGQQGPRPNTVSTTGVPGRGRPSKPTHSSMEVNDGNSGDDLEVPLCSAHTRYVRPRAALNSNLEWRWKLFLVLNKNLLSKVHHQSWLKFKLLGIRTGGKTLSMIDGGQHDEAI